MSWLCDRNIQRHFRNLDLFKAETQYVTGEVSQCEDVKVSG